MLFRSSAFAPSGSVSRPAVRSASIDMGMNTRRELFAQGAAALVAGAAVLPANAKAGQFGKQELFGFSASSPYATEGLDPQGTYGYKTVGDKLATGYEADISREKGYFDKGVTEISKLQKSIDIKEWWRVRDNLRVQAYEMRGAMLAINKVSKDPKASAKAYKKVFSEIESLDLACVKKEQDLANKEYSDVLAALDAYKSVAL